MSSYYGRRHTRTENGAVAFAQPEDREAEDQAKATMEELWDCTLHRYSAGFAPLDWYAVRGDRIVAWIELKRRSHTSTKHPTVFLNYRKYRALWETWATTGVPAFYVVAFDDCTRYINVLDVDAKAIRMGGCREVVKALNDREPVIEIPVERMKSL